MSGTTTRTMVSLEFEQLSHGHVIWNSTKLGLAGRVPAWLAHAPCVVGGTTWLEVGLEQGLGLTGLFWRRSGLGPKARRA